MRKIDKRLRVNEVQTDRLSKIGEACLHITEKLDL